MQFLRKKGLFESGRVLYLSVDSLRPNPNQPRTQFSQEGLEELSASIQEHGILQPLSVRRVEGGYELVSGERRLRAAKLAGLREVPCIAVDVDDTASSLLALGGGGPAHWEVPIGSSQQAAALEASSGSAVPAP